MYPPTRRRTPRKKTPTSAHAISSPALSPIKSTTKTEAEETQHIEIETPAPRQALSLQEQIAQQRIIIREMEAVMMMNWRRRQDDLAMDPLALLVVPKAPSIQPVQGATHPFPHQDSQECSNFKQNPRDQVDSFAVSASQASPTPLGSATTYQRTTVQDHYKSSCNLANETLPPEEGHVVDILSSTKARIDPNANCSPNFDTHDLPRAISSPYSGDDVSSNADTALGSQVETSNRPKCSLNDVGTTESVDKSPHRPESTKNNSVTTKTNSTLGSSSSQRQHIG
ncbi:unnamed protein product [Aphanomyces euteiches]